ncbi:MAG: hypothetical protein KC776_43310 [Myxococcales bacterium]|nr:hypothetical protein [Myxococcales bacterium]MCB9582317.1 hypothetical protein [Polyangiaceae bacterium]
MKFPDVPSSTSLAWRMGYGEAYLRFTFFPWWRRLGSAQKLCYLDTWSAPRDWRRLLLELSLP